MCSLASSDGYRSLCALRVKASAAASSNSSPRIFATVSRSTHECWFVHAAEATAPHLVPSHESLQKKHSCLRAMQPKSRVKAQSQWTARKSGFLQHLESWRYRTPREIPLTCWVPQCPIIKPSKDNSKSRNGRRDVHAFVRSQRVRLHERVPCRHLLLRIDRLQRYAKLIIDSDGFARSHLEVASCYPALDFLAIWKPSLVLCRMTIIKS